MNILIIPSWFSDSSSPNAGTFFLEEAHLISAFHSVAILVFERKEIELEKNNDESILVDRYSKNIVYFRVKLYYDKKSSWDDIILSFRGVVKKTYEDIIAHGFIPDLIHAYATFLGGFFAYWISCYHKVPYMITEHFGPFNPDFLHSSLVKKFFHDSIENANLFACVSSHLRQQILMQGIKCNPIVVGNYVNDKLFTLLPKKTNDIKLLSVAYYPSYIKDIDNLLAAYTLLREQGIIYKAVIVGGGEIKGGYNGTNIIANKVSEYGLSDIVQIIGSANRMEMAELMHNCTFLVSSSIAESFGVSICEAMLCGKPCIITDNGGSRDFATSNNSIIVRVHDPMDLAAGIKEAINKLDDFCGSKIRETIEVRYGKDAFLSRINTLYNSIIHG